MGIDNWVSRAALPGAAPSRRRRVVRRVAPTTGPGASSVPPAAVKSVNVGGIAAEIALEIAPEIEPEIASEPEQTASSNTPAVMFSAAVVFLGGWYWIDEVPRGRETGADYSQLLQAIATALNLPQEAPRLERFDWPLPSANRLDPGLETARHSFEGFMRGRLERQPVEGVILLGSAACEWLNLDMFAGLRQVQTVSAWSMLRQQASKAKAWQDLRVLRSSV